MELSSLDFAGLGKFDPENKATFKINTLNLPSNWEYIYQNQKLLLKVDQYGPVYAQADPPSDIVLFRREGFQRYSSWHVWLRSDDFKCGAFTNYFYPIMNPSNPSVQPDFIEITFAPILAKYVIEYESIRCTTELFVPSGERAICLNVEITNLRDKPIKLSAIPVLRPYANPAMLAPWDKPEWYLSTSLCEDKQLAFVTRLLNMNSEPDKRRTVGLWSSIEGVSASEISYEHFVGNGTFENPQAIAEGELRLSPKDALGWEKFGKGGQNDLWLSADSCASIRFCS